MTKNVTGVRSLSTLRFILVLHADYFFTNLVLNYPEKSGTHFIDTPSFSSLRHLMLISILFAMLVSADVMASSTVVTNATSTLMSSVV
jgi:hypothetical protein